MAITVALDVNNTAAQNKAEIVNALASYTRGGEIRLPRADAPFLCSPGIVWPSTRNLSLVGEGCGNGYDDSNAGTQLKFVGSSGVGIDCNQVNISDPAAPYAFIGGISFNGDHTVPEGLKLGGILQMERCEVKYFASANILTGTLVNSMLLRDVSSLGSGGYGFLMGALLGGATPNNTRIIFEEFRSRSNLVGARFEQAQGVRWNGGVIEANYNEGLQIYRPVGRVLSDLLFRDVWFEANWRGALGYAIDIDGDGVSPEAVRFHDCSLNVGGLSKAMRVNRLDGGLLSAPHGSGQIDLGSNCHGFGLLDAPAGYTVTDGGLGNWRKSLSGIGESVPVGGGSGTWPVTAEHTLPDTNQIMTAAQLVSANCEMFPTVNRTVTLPNAADIITAMGGYDLGATAEFVIMNRTSVSGVKIIFLGGANVSLKGNNQIGNGSGLFAVRIDSPTEVSVINKSQN